MSKERTPAIFTEEIKTRIISIPQTEVVFTAPSIPSSRRSHPKTINTVIPSPLEGKMSIEDIKKKIKNRQIRWDVIAQHPVLLNELLTKAAEEVSLKLSPTENIVLPASALEYNDLADGKFDFLDGGGLRGLCRYFKSKAIRENVMTLILKSAVLEPSIEDIVIIKKLGRRVQWERFYGRPLNAIFHKIARQPHIDKPVSLLERQDLEAPHDFLNGENFKQLYDHAATVSQAKGIPPMIYLHEKGNIKATAEDIIIGINNNIDIPWQQVGGEGLGKFLEQVAKVPEIKKPVFLLVDDDLMKELALIGDHRLLGLRDYIERNKGTDTAITFLLKFGKISVKATDIFLSMKTHPDIWKKLSKKRKDELFTIASVIPQIIEAMKTQQLLWNDLPPEIQTKIIEQAMQENEDRESEKKEQTESSYLGKDLHPSLTFEQQQIIFHYIKSGIPIDSLRKDPNFLETFHGDTKRQQIETILINSNTPKDVLMFCYPAFVKSIAITFEKSPLSLQKRIEAGFDGLSTAIDKFEIERGLTLTSYASWRIINAIQKAIAEKGYIFPIPMSIIKEHGVITYLEEIFIKLFQRKPTREELKAQAVINTNLRISLIDNILDFLYLVKPLKLNSLNEPLLSDIKSKKRVTREQQDLVSTSVQGPEDSITKILLEDALYTLTKNERVVLNAFGAGFSLPDIARKTKLSVSKIEEIFKSGLAKLRKDPSLQELKEDRLLPDKAVVFDRNDHTKDDDLITSLSGLTSTTTENYMAIIDFRKQGKTNKEIAEILGLSLTNIGQIMSTELLPGGLVEKRNPGMSGLLIQAGLLTQEEVARRKNEPKERSAYVSELTEKVGAYLRDNPVSSFKLRMFKKRNMRRTNTEKA